MANIEIQQIKSAVKIPVRKTVGVILSTELYDWLKKYATDQELSVSAVIRTLLVELRKKEKRHGR